MTPENFLQPPMDSVKQSYEAEIVARNIMVILSKTGNEFRCLSWEEYKAARLEDGNFTERKSVYFEEVGPYTLSDIMAVQFSPVWAEAAEEASDGY